MQPVIILLVKGSAVCRGLKTSAGCFLGASLWNSFLIDPELTGGLIFPVGRLSERVAKRKLTGYWMKRVTSSSWGSSRVTRDREDIWCCIGLKRSVFVSIQRNTLTPRNCQNGTVWTEIILLKASPGSFVDAAHTVLLIKFSWFGPQPCGPGFPFREQSLDRVYGSRYGNTHSHSEGG